MKCELEKNCFENLISCYSGHSGSSKEPRPVSANAHLFFHMGGDSHEAIGDDNLSQLIINFRFALDTANAKKGFTSRPMCEFPYDCCEHASLLLARYLLEHGVEEIKVVRAKKDPVSSPREYHVWLKSKRFAIVDITVDQFPRENRPVETPQMTYIGPIQSGYKQYQIVEESSPEQYLSAFTDEQIFELDEEYRIALNSLIEK